MTPTEAVKMLREALRPFVDELDHVKDPAPVLVVARAALATTAEPAPTYSADDLRKVAEAVHAYAFEEECGPMNDADRDALDAIIAKAVGK